jgi:hypothetical protein
MLLKRIFGPKKDDLTGGCRKLHNKKLNNFYTSQIFVRKINSRNIKWIIHVARVERKEVDKI